uniref:Uncharacterized protein n=1 Tax=Romanomermis culicivorax TaxID=13658 RepID=A0A915HHQ7_ROMCU
MLQWKIVVQMPEQIFIIDDSLVLKLQKADTLTLLPVSDPPTSTKNCLTIKTLKLYTFNVEYL